MADPVPDTKSRRPRGPWQEAWRRLRRNRLAMACLVTLGFVTVVCWGHPLLMVDAGSDPESAAPYRRHYAAQQVEQALQPPSGQYWFGTDAVGRDLFARTLQGGRISMVIAVFAALVSLLVGVTVGSVAGYAGGRLDDVMMRMVDVLYGVPFLFLIILVMTITNDIQASGAFELTNEAKYPIIFITIGLFSWMTLARITRGQVLSLREQDFVTAARALGASNARIIRRHVIPNVLGVVIVYTTLTLPGVILTESFLSFLGLGIPEPSCSWGTLCADGFEAMSLLDAHWWLLTFPGLVMAMFLFSLNILGDGLRDALDPRMKR